MAFSWTNFSRLELRDDSSLPEYVQECKLRRSSCAFISETGTSLKMPQLTVATATIFYHRFFAIHPLLDFSKDRRHETVAMTCLFLAGKVEETPRKLKHVIEICFQHLNHGTQINASKDKESEEYLLLREQVLLHEFLLLQTLAFDLTIEHPYKTLLIFIKYLKADKELAQFAWNFVNDSLRTTVCLQFPPNVIALACIYLAAKYRRSILADGKKWWSEHHITIDQLHIISTQILELYYDSPDMEVLKKSMERDKENDSHSNVTSLSTTPSQTSTSPPSSSVVTVSSISSPMNSISEQKSEINHQSPPRKSELRRSRSPNPPNRRSLSPPKNRGDVSPPPSKREGEYRNGSSSNATTVAASSSISSFSSHHRRT